MMADNDPEALFADATGFVEPPGLRRLGTLAELTQGPTSGSDDGVGGLNGDNGDTSELG